MLASQLSPSSRSLMLLQDRDNLLLLEPCSLHLSVLLRARLQRFLEEIVSGRSNVRRMRSNTRLIWWRMLRHGR